MCLFFFFFKQKTAYEMRISDWSSDVCSSDLNRPVPRCGCGLLSVAPARPGGAVHGADHRPAGRGGMPRPGAGEPLSAVERAFRRKGRHREPAARSEEHTSELQSLMRISYAVFCLKKKTT